MTEIRARDLGIPFDGTAGPHNAITDVAGLEVGMTTCISGHGALEIGRGPVRTGITVIHPRGRHNTFEPVWAGHHIFNGNGEMSGVHWVEEAGHFSGPVALTSTTALGMAHHAINRWLVAHPAFQGKEASWSLPVVTETWDGHLNDVHGQHLSADDVIHACDSAAGGAVAEGNVGGGTGMVCYEFKGGTGTASRMFEAAGTWYTLGVLVQANFGRRRHLRVRGVPVGWHLDANRRGTDGDGSVIAVCATDAPLLPTHLQRIARRLGIGIARTGTPGDNSSGDFMLAFSTGNPVATTEGRGQLEHLTDAVIDPAFEAAADATEEAVINALVAAETMTGRDGHTVHAIDHAAVAALMASRAR